ncbi:hypothetical protein B0H14DRAFT_2978849 [Mycena olivaceomarginata]|nr:hypothetical protein B0H14DRAFT_2978849 [Mycena olivaceomarginata]
MPFFKLKRRNVQSSVAQPSDTPVATTPPAPQNESAREAPAPTAPDSVTKPAALNAFKTTLEVLGKAPLPGIGMVAAAALESSKDTGSVKEGWDGLAERMERLSNKNFVAFWNTSADGLVEAYGKKLDTFLVFCGTIGLSRDVLGEKISAYLEDIHRSATRSMIMEFSENTIGLRIISWVPLAKINAQNKNRGGDMQMTANKTESVRKVSIGFMNGQINTALFGNGPSSWQVETRVNN